MRTNFDQLLEAGAHFGHLKRKWNPAMAPYIYMERNGIHIIDLNKTAIKIDEAAEALKNLARSGRKVLFVGTKKQAQEVVAAHAQEVGMPYITERWAGGMLTNFPPIRKAVQKMKLAAKFGLPIICLIDTPGAYPGQDSEERGIAQAIAESMYEMTLLRTPIVCVVIGEGGSGGACGIGLGDRVAMLPDAY